MLEVVVEVLVDVLVLALELVDVLVVEAVEVVVRVRVLVEEDVDVVVAVEVVVRQVQSDSRLNTENLRPLPLIIHRRRTQRHTTQYALECLLVPLK